MAINIFKDVDHCKTLCFRCILISQFPYVENLLHVNLADLPVNFIKQFVSCYFWCLYQILLSKFLSYYCLHYILPRSKNIVYHITEMLIFYADQLMVMGNSKNSRVFNSAILLKSRKFYVHEYTCFTAYVKIFRVNSIPKTNHHRCICCHALL